MATKEIKQAIIWGAGRVGRGIWAPVLAQAGLAVTFVDTNAALLESLREHNRYCVQYLDGRAQYIMEGYGALHVSQKEALLALLEKPDVLVCVAVPEPSLSNVIRALVELLQKRMAAENVLPVKVLLSVSMQAPAQLVRESLKLLLGEQAGACMLPIDTAVPGVIHPAGGTLRQMDPLSVVVGGGSEVFVGEEAGELAPELSLTLCEDVEALGLRRLYLVGMSRAYLAYLGSLKGYMLMREAAEDVSIRDMLKGAQQEAALALHTLFNWPMEEMRKQCEQLLHVFQNPAWEEAIAPVAHDVWRKLAREERLVGPALLCYKFDIVPQMLAVGIAAAYGFAPASKGADGSTLEYIHKEGMAAALKRFSGIEPEHPLQVLVSQAWAALEGVYEALRPVNVPEEDGEVLVNQEGE